MINHTYQITENAGLNDVHYTIKYSYIDDELEICRITLTLAGTSQLSKIYVDPYFYARYESKYKDVLIKKAKKDIEDLKND